MFTDGEEELKEEEAAAAALRVLCDKKPRRRVFQTAERGEREEGESGNPVMQRPDWWRRRK